MDLFLVVPAILGLPRPDIAWLPCLGGADERATARLEVQLSFASLRVRGLLHRAP